MSAYHTVTVPVVGGKLFVGVWGDSGPVIVCSHGITANHVSFKALARRLSGRYRLLVPDHRGRGESAAIATMRLISGSLGASSEWDNRCAMQSSAGSRTWRM